MRKKFMTLTITVIFTLLTLCTGFTVSAAEVVSNSSEISTISAIANELKKYEKPFCGYSGMDFDLNHDGTVDTFDMVLLKREIISGKPGVSVATAVRLQSWLLGKPYSTLSVYHNPTTFLGAPSAHSNDCLKNLTSNDFDFLKAEKTVMAGWENPDEDYTYGITLYFLSYDEYATDSIFIDTFCNDPSEFEEFVTEDEGFYIGIKKDKYALAVKGEISQKEFEREEEPEYDLGPAYMMYDLRNVAEDDVDQIISNLSHHLTSDGYTSITVSYYLDDCVKIHAFNERAEMDIIVEKGFRQGLTPYTTIFVNEDDLDQFELFYSKKYGFQVNVKPIELQ